MPVDFPSSKSSRGKQREDAIANLIQAYQEQYNSSTSFSFFVSPLISFVATDEYGSIAVHAREDIPPNTLLLQMPKKTRVTTYSRDKVLQKLLKDLEISYQQHADDVITTNVPGEMSKLQGIIEYGELALAVVLMHALAKSANADDNVKKEESILYKVLQTWPTLEELRGCCSIWEPSRDRENSEQLSAWDLLQGTYTVEMLRLTYTAHKFLLQTIVQPVLERHALAELFATTNDTNGVKPSISDAYWHASYLVRSRAYEDSLPQKSNKSQQKRPNMMPLVDLINGLATSCASLGKVNVYVDHSAKDGMTTVTSLGPSFNCKDSNESSAIKAGTELIVSYGDHSVTGFISRYGCCPQEMVACFEHVTDDVLLRLPRSLGPPDRLQVWACQEMGYPSTSDAVEQYKCFLPHSSLAPFSDQMQANTFVLFGGKDGGGLFSEGDILQTYYRQIPQLAVLCQYLEMCHMASEQEVICAVNTQQLRVEGAMELHVSHMLQLAVDHTITDRTDLNSSVNQLDSENANADTTPLDLVTAYRARIFQRDALAQWRHAFSQRHGFPSEHTETAYYGKYMEGQFKDHFWLPKLPKATAPECLLSSGGCRFCGRTVKLLSCGKCGIMKYCSKDHQKADWKYHKKLCDPNLAAKTCN